MLAGKIAQLTVILRHERTIGILRCMANWQGIQSATTFSNQDILHAGSFQKFFNVTLPSRGVDSFLPASKGEVQTVQSELQSENDQQNKIINQQTLVINQQNMTINQLVEQIYALWVSK